VPFAPEDPDAVASLANALIGAPPDVAPNTNAAVPVPPAPQREPKDPRVPSGPDGSSQQISAVEVGAGVVTLLSAAGLLYIGLTILGGSEPVPNATPEVPKATASAANEPAPSGTPAPGIGAPTTTAEVSALLAAVTAADSTRFPASSCQAGADAVTCMNPAPNISTVVLTPYQTPTELYAAYTAAVEAVSGEPMAENTGNCSNSESEGEVGWNLDKQHTLDFSVVQQVNGGLDPATQSAGRMFCTDSHKVMTLVWTRDPGLLVTATGQPSEMVVSWWSDVHLQLEDAL
jgi:hypothetical protein